MNSKNFIHMMNDLGKEDQKPIKKFVSPTHQYPMTYILITLPDGRQYRRVTMEQKRKCNQCENYTEAYCRPHRDLLCEKCYVCMLKPKSKL